MRLFRGDDTSTWEERYGDKSAGAVTIAANTTYPGARSGLDGNHTSGSFTVKLKSASTFANGMCVQITRERGTGIGDSVTKEFNVIVSGGGTTTLTMKYPLDIDYYDNAGGNDRAQIVEMKQYSSLTINAGVTFSAPDWDGTSGGRIPFFVNGTFTFAGDLSVDGKGFRGHAAGVADPGDTGEGTAGNNIANQYTPNGNGGGGGWGGTGSGGSGGGGGGFRSAGSNGTQRGSVPPGQGGNQVGNADLSSHPMGGAGGSGGGTVSSVGGGSGDGAGGITIRAKTITQSGTGKIKANGATGTCGIDGGTGCGGSGSGGGIDIGCQTGTFGVEKVESFGAPGVTGTGVSGGTGSLGINSLRYSGSYTGEAIPTFNVYYDEYLSDTYACDAIFSKSFGKFQRSIAKKKLMKRSYARQSSSVHSAVASSQLQFVYNIYQYQSSLLQFLYNLVRVDARQTYVPEVVQPGTWTAPEATDPSERNE